MFSSNQTHEGKQKDSAINAEQTGRFCWNLATWDLRDAVNISSEQVPFGIDEFERAGLEKEDSTVVKVNGKPVPMVKDSPVRFECEYYTTLKLPGNPPMGTADVIIGRVVGVHISEDALTDGLVDVLKTKPIARMGYYTYTVVENSFEMIPPGSEMMRVGLEGNTRLHGKMEKNLDG
jgi:flavin reductase (DIM6/NTAB) family NADH-FMN oxidoreductase RutF